MRRVEFQMTDALITKIERHAVKTGDTRNGALAKLITAGLKACATKQK